MSFGPAEYFGVILFGLIAAGTVAQGAPIKGLTMVALGLAIGMVGTDLNTGYVRYDLGFYELHDGVSIIVLAMGLFGISEVISSIGTNMRAGFKNKITMRSMLPTRDEARRSVAPMMRGSGVGVLAGPLPGTGPSLAAFLAYVFEKRVSRDPSKFGKGAIEGLAAPEAANNAAVQTAFIPMLSMGIPGTATTAVMLGALMIHGIQPGPRLVTQMPELFWGVIASFWIGNLLLLLLNIPFIGVWVSILKVPYRYLYPAVICLVCIGVYAINNNVFDVWLVLFFGIVGYVMRLLEFEPAPLLIGFILGPLLEENLRRALLLFRGDYSMFLQRPISATLIAMSVLLLVYIIWSRFRVRRVRPEPASTE
jgi:putative tricarboxylic transport membrane protein